MCVFWCFWPEKKKKKENKTRESFFVKKPSCTLETNKKYKKGGVMIKDNEWVWRSQKELEHAAEKPS